MCATAALSFESRGTFTLTAPSTSENRLAVTISTVARGFPASDTKTTDVSGNLQASVDIDPTSRATTKFTIHSGNLAMSNMAFKFKVVIFIFPVDVATVNTAGMKGTAFTTAPPGLATPSSGGGTFDAALHSVVINQGTMSGLDTTTTPPTSFLIDFAATPILGLGQGTGTISVTWGTSTATHRNGVVTLELPVDFTQLQDVDGTAVTVKVKGKVKATSSMAIPLNSWIEWTGVNDLAGAAFDHSLAPDAAPLGIAWAMGHAPLVANQAILPTMMGGATPSATITLPPAGNRAALLLEQSDSLAENSWQPVSPAATSLGRNPIPIGTSGAVTVQWASPAARRFVRISAQQP